MQIYYSLYFMIFITKLVWERQEDGAECKMELGKRSSILF